MSAFLDDDDDPFEGRAYPSHPHRFHTRLLDQDEAIEFAGWLCADVKHEIIQRGVGAPAWVLAERILNIERNAGPIKRSFEMHFENQTEAILCRLSWG